MNKYFIGSTRFSIYVPGSSQWRMTAQDEEKYLKDLYARERMKPRLDIFINRTLPAMAQMSENYFFRHILQYSNLMPEEYKDQIIEAAYKYKFLFLQPIDIHGGSSVSTNNILNEKEDGVIAWFRVDDDDILSINFLDMLSFYAYPSFCGMTINFGKGYAAKYHKGKFSNFREIYHRFIAIGQSYIFAYNKHQAISFPKIVPHSEVDKTYPSVVDSRSAAFLYTRHDGQDTVHGMNGNNTNNEADTYLINQPRCTSFKELSEKFPTLAQDAHADQQEEEEFLSINPPILIQGEAWEAEKLLIGGHEYHVEYSITIPSNSYYPKAAIIFLGTPTYPDKEVHGLIKSKNAHIGFFRYLRAAPTGTETKFSFAIPAGVNLPLRIKAWDTLDSTPHLMKLRISFRRT